MDQIKKYMGSPMRTVIVLFGISIIIAAMIFHIDTLFQKHGLVDGMINLFQSVTQGFLLYPWYVAFALHCVVVIIHDRQLYKVQDNIQAIKKEIRKFSIMIGCISMGALVLQGSLLFVGIEDNGGLLFLAVIYAGIPLFVYALMSVAYAVKYYVRSRNLELKDLKKDLQ